MSRNRGTSQEREQARKARAKARQAVSCWAAGGFGPRTRIPQESIRQVMGKDLGVVVKRYPKAILKDGKKNLWDMPVLADSLRFDDPVTMPIPGPGSTCAGRRARKAVPRLRKTSFAPRCCG